MTPELVRAARSLVQWSQNDLAQQAGVAVSTVADFERGQRVPVTNNALAIRRALEMAGVVFTPGGVSHGLRWTFLTETAMSTLNVTFRPEDFPLVLELATIFGEAATSPPVSINAIQCATPDLKAKLSAFVATYGKSLPHTNRLKKAICDLADGAFFLLLPVLPSSSEEIVGLESLVHRLNHPDEATYESEQEEIFGALMREYDVTMPRIDKNIGIGNPRKKDRVCRFCGGTLANGETRFDDEAHAISASLGNKYLKLHDECDACNHHFGENIEQTLLELLNIQRVFLGIESRGKRPTFEFPGGEMRHDGERMVIKVSHEISENAAGVLSARLASKKPIVPMRFYQALAKIALSVIPEKELSSLKKTIKWVRFDEFAGTRLPEIASAVVPLPPSPSAQIALYIRRSVASTLPHVVCEFRLGCYLYVYVLPFSDKDSGDLVGFFGATDFRDTFRHYTHVQSWSIDDFSGTHEVPIIQTIKLVSRDMAGSLE